MNRVNSKGNATKSSEGTKTPKAPTSAPINCKSVTPRNPPQIVANHIKSTTRKSTGSTRKVTTPALSASKPCKMSLPKPSKMTLRGKDKEQKL